MLLSVVFVFFMMQSPVMAQNTDSQAIQWLDKMSKAMKTLDYNGTVAFFKNGRLDAMRYYHATAASGLEQERLLSLNSPMREVIREAGKVSCVFKESAKIVVDHQPVSESFLLDLPSDFSSIQSAYHFSKAGEQSVAMLPAQVISIVPKDGYRYPRKVWIDKLHFLPLKVEVYNLSGATMEQVVFTNLQVGLKQTFQRVAHKFEDRDVVHVHQTQRSSFADADFYITSMPVGFKVAYYAGMNAENSTSTVDHLLLSDGFSTVSVYKEAIADDIQPGLQTLGSVNSFTKVIGPYQITVLGEVPAKTVQLIAQNVKFH